MGSLKSESSAFGAHWQQLLTELAQEAPSPGSHTLCLHLNPAWEEPMVRQKHQETLEAQRWLQSGFQWPELPAKTDWLKTLLAHPGVNTKAFKLFMKAWTQIGQSLPAKTYPVLSR